MYICYASPSPLPLHGSCLDVCKVQASYNTTCNAHSCKKLHEAHCIEVDSCTCVADFKRRGFDGPCHHAAISSTAWPFGHGAGSHALLLLLRGRTLPLAHMCAGLLALVILPHDSKLKVINTLSTLKTLCNGPASTRTDASLLVAQKFHLECKLPQTSSSRHEPAGATHVRSSLLTRFK